MSFRKYIQLSAVLVIGVIFGMVSVWAYGAATKWIGALGVAQAATPAVPTELRVPVLGIDAKILPIGLTANGDLGAPINATTVVWYKNGTRPGAPGIAIIDGHLDTIHSPEAVFYNLGKLKPGDKINIQNASGTTVTFKVKTVKTYPYNTPTRDIFTAPPGIVGLDLITCAGDWMPNVKLYNERLVVFAVKE